MTNPNDHWRHQTSAAPHAPSHDVQTPGLPLQGSQTSFNSSSDADAFYPTGVARRGDGTLGMTLGLAIVAFLFAGPIFGTLYPLSAAAALVTGLVVNGVLSVAMPSLGSDGRLPFALLAAAIVFWTVSRRDHRMAAVPAYRWARHVVRIVLVAIFVSTTSLHKFDSMWPRSASQVRALFADPRFLPLAAVVAVVAHLLLTRGYWVREQWHIMLQLFRLRPSE